MKQCFRTYLFLCLCAFCSLSALDFPVVPVSYEGRFLPLESYSKKWLYEHYHRHVIKKDQLEAFHLDSTDALKFIWQLHLNGHWSWDDSPLFWVHLAEVKKTLGLPLKQDHFNYNTLHQAIYEAKETSLAMMKKLIAFHYHKAYQDPSNFAGRTKLELTQLSPGLWVNSIDSNLTLLEIPNIAPWNLLKTGMIINDLSNPIEEMPSQSTVDELHELISSLARFKELLGTTLPMEHAYLKTFLELREQSIPSKQIALTLEQQYPLRTRLQGSGSLLKMLPGKLFAGEWYSLNALLVQVYNPSSQQLEPARNFTSYPDALFTHLRETYQHLLHSIEKGSIIEANNFAEELFYTLKKGYQPIASSVYKQAAGKQLSYPSVNQLAAENFYSKYPLILACIAGYALALLGIGFGYFLNNRSISLCGTLILTLTFFLHGLLLFLRSYILARPPVSNMFETLLYVPWVATFTGLLLWLKYRQNLLMAAAATTSLALMALLQITHIDASFTNVQAVLDSQYWLIIHVLMVVGSYGIFILCGVLGHAYLAGMLWNKNETESMAFIGKFILQTMYLGVALLVPGTLLGGVWAAESWGRFWDWDPKEAWAFISICIYLIWIHAYRFNKIGYPGLAIGAVSGLLVISFTWYGVNYILGTGLHSYGFGQGGEEYYYAYILLELLFLTAVTIVLPKRSRTIPASS